MCSSSATARRRTSSNSRRRLSSSRVACSTVNKSFSVAEGEVAVSASAEGPGSSAATCLRSVSRSVSHAVSSALRSPPGGLPARRPSTAPDKRSAKPRKRPSSAANSRRSSTGTPSFGGVTARGETRSCPGASCLVLAAPDSVSTVSPRWSARAAAGLTAFNHSSQSFADTANQGRSVLRGGFNERGARD